MGHRNERVIRDADQGLSENRERADPLVREAAGLTTIRILSAARSPYRRFALSPYLPNMPRTSYPSSDDPHRQRSTKQSAGNHRRAAAPRPHRGHRPLGLGQA